MAFFESFDIGFGDRLIANRAEKEGDVDVDPGGGQAAENAIVKGAKKYDDRNLTSKDP